MKQVILISQNFAPANFSGTVRAFHFARHLSEFGWWPHVLARYPAADLTLDIGLLEELKGRCDITYVWQSANNPITRQLRRVEAYLRARQNRGWRMLAKGVRLLSWVWGQCAWRATQALFYRAACKIARRHDIAVVWATGDPWLSFDIARRITGRLAVPFVMDQRDPWTYGPMWQPSSRASARRQMRRERLALQAAAAVIYTSPLTMEKMRQRVEPGLAAKMLAICNGYADDSQESVSEALKGDTLTFRYIGSLKEHRSPEPLLAAVKFLCAGRAEIAGRLFIEFIGPTGCWTERLQGEDVEWFVRVTGAVSYHESCRLMASADALVLLQTLEDGCDVISGKAFEYMASGRPILGVIPEAGGDAWLLRETGSGLIADFRDTAAVAGALADVYDAWMAGRLNELCGGKVPLRFSRRHLAGELAAILDRVSGNTEEQESDG